MKDNLTFNALAISNALKILTFSYQDFIMAIKSSLSTLQQLLTRLRVESINYNNDQSRQEGASAIAEALKVNS
jgi:hypothetical protein